MTWIIFDAADTLLSPAPAVAEVYQRVAATHGVDSNASEIKLRFAPAIRTHFAEEVSSEQLDRQRWQELVFDVLQTDKTEIFDELWNHFAQPASWDIYKDVEPCWTRLMEAGYRIAIASNFDARLLNIVRAKPILTRAEHVFISSHLGFRKPSSKFYGAIQEQLGVSAQELTMVGDSESADFHGAVNAGWKAWHLVRGEVNPKAPRIDTLLSLTPKSVSTL